MLIFFLGGGGGGGGPNYFMTISTGKQDTKMYNRVYAVCEVHPKKYLIP